MIEKLATFASAYKRSPKTKWCIIKKIGSVCRGVCEGWGGGGGGESAALVWDDIMPIQATEALWDFVPFVLCSLAVKVNPPKSPSPLCLSCGVSLPQLL